MRLTGYVLRLAVHCRLRAGGLLVAQFRPQPGGWEVPPPAWRLGGAPSATFGAGPFPLGARPSFLDYWGSLMTTVWTILSVKVWFLSSQRGQR